jgi:uncharacterized protein YkwD
MFHVKRILFIFIACLFSRHLCAQGSITFSDKPFVLSIPKDTSLQLPLQRNTAFNSLTPEEQEVMYWINYVRLKPQSFNSAVLTPFLTQFPEAKSAYSRSLISDLKDAKPVVALSPSSKLNGIAAAHAKDLGIKGMDISHSSSSGLSFQQRMNAAGLQRCVAENMYEGRLTPLESVIFLLIDHGVKNLGHRKNLLDPNVKIFGVSFYPIKGRPETYFLVQDFACE